MTGRSLYLLCCALLCFCSAVGCSSARSQVAKVQEEKEQLISAIRAQKESLDELRSENEKLSRQLHQAEIEIARGPYFGERQLASRSLQSTKENLAQSALKDATKHESAAETDIVGSSVASSAGSTPAKPAENVSAVPSLLPWKPTRDDSTLAAADRSLAEELQQWSNQREWLAFDSRTRTVEAQIPVTFQEDGVTLSVDTKNQLDDLAQLLKATEGKSFRVMVAGESKDAEAAQAGQRYTDLQHLGSAQAQAVAGYLDRHGLTRDRLGVAARESLPTADSSAAPPRLSIHVLPQDIPILGWTPPSDSVRR